jgi:hypothetical protein
MMMTQHRGAPTLHRSFCYTCPYGVIALPGTWFGEGDDKSSAADLIGKPARVGGAVESRCRRLRMGSVARWTGGRRTLAIVAFATSLTACASIQNMVPDPANFKLPDRATLLPPTSSSYAAPLSATTAVRPADLVDGQGVCAGSTSSDAAASGRGVGLDMTECQVVRALGQPQAVDVTPQPGGRRHVVITYKTGERAGIYEFVDGRLTGIERGEDPPPAVVKKPAAKKPKPPA